MIHAKVKTATVVALLIAGSLGIGAASVMSRVGAEPPAASQQKQSNATEQKEKSQSPAGAKTDPATPLQVRVTGRVLDSDGKPLAGAKLYSPRLAKLIPTSEKDIALDVVGTSDTDGRFDVKFHFPFVIRTYLIAHAEGFGVDWIEFTERKPAVEDVTLRLTQDVPITGRVVNTEAKPIAGVSVSALYIYVPDKENLDDYLAGWLRSFQDNLSSPRKRLYCPIDGIIGTVTTDKDGRFTIRGAGAERIVHLVFEGKGVARSTPYIITRKGFDPKPYNDALNSKANEHFISLNPFPGVHGPDMTFVAEVGKTVAGLVKDADTGKPLAGCQIHAHTGFGDGVSTATDAAGKYRLTGLPKNDKGYQISLMPSKESNYLRRIASAPDTGGYAPVNFDIELVKGVVVTGRVVDRQTGKGVEAGVRFAPLTNNKFFGSKPGFDNYRSDRTMDGTEKDGRFRIVTIPGKALVTAQVHSGETLNGQHACPYRRALPDPDHKDLFKDDGDGSWIVSTAGGLEFLSTENAVKVIDISESGETTVELLVDRGVTGNLTVQDPDGQPLAGAWIAGLTEHWPITFHVTEPTVTVYALNPEKPRTVAIYHPEKKLGGIATIRGDENEPVVAKLGPLATISGRFIDTDGAPLAGAEISINGQGPANELYRFANPSGKPVTTDKDGRFTVAGVVPGITFYLQTRQGEKYYGGKPKLGLLQLKPGEARNLGDRTMEQLQ